MRHIIWRNRASAILGLLVMIIPLTGFPETIRDSFIILLGFLIAIFGFSRNSVGSYSHHKNETSGANSEVPKIVSSEGKVDGMSSKKKHHRKSFIRPSQEKIESEVVLSSESEIVSKPTESLS